MRIKGYASTGDLDLVHHVVAANAFDASIKAKGIKGPKGIKLLHAHDNKRILGGITKLEPRNDGLWIEAFIEEGISYGKDVALAAKATGGLSYSVGFYLQDAELREDARGDEYLLITKAELEEVSVVTFPAQPNAVFVEMEDDK